MFYYTTIVKVVENKCGTCGFDLPTKSSFVYLAPLRYVSEVKPDRNDAIPHQRTHIFRTMLLSISEMGVTFARRHLSRRYP